MRTALAPRRRSCFVLFLYCCLIASPSLAQSAAPAAKAAPRRAAANTPEQRAARYLDTIRDQPSLLLEFIRELPKGADLHNHLSGAVYAESYINFAARDGLCIDRKTYRASAPDKMPADAQPAPDGKPPKPACDESKGLVPAARAFGDGILYREIVDAWSMRQVPAGESGHDHFFDTFGKFNAAKGDHMGDMLAEVVSRAAHGRLLHIEFTLNPDSGAAGRLATGLGWDGDMAALRQKLVEKQIEKAVADGRMTLDRAEQKMKADMNCGTLNADPGCGVSVRYLYEVNRLLPREQVFAQMLAGFEMATADPRVVGVNIVAPEDGYVAMRDFSLHMQMFAYLKSVFPKVRLSLHAGELAPPLVPPEGLTFHIRESINVGKAERIGHGVDVMYERDPAALLKEMARKRVLVEICLTSNDQILGVRGIDHPLLVYLKYGVPVALATDDEGVARSDINQEYLRAVESYRFPYSTLKMFARNSLEYSFLPGASLWSDATSFRRAACQADKPTPDGSALTAACQKFMQASERARAQWALEAQFAEFESKFGAR